VQDHLKEVIQRREAAHASVIQRQEEESQRAAHASACKLRSPWRALRPDFLAPFSLLLMCVVAAPRPPLVCSEWLLQGI
jgi:hypothetical protein